MKAMHVIFASFVLCLGGTASGQLSEQQVVDAFRSNVKVVNGSTRPDEVSVISTMQRFFRRYSEDNAGWSSSDWSVIQRFKEAQAQLQKENNELLLKELQVACDAYAKGMSAATVDPSGFANHMVAVTNQNEAKERALYFDFSSRLTPVGQFRLDDILTTQIAPNIRSTNLDVLALVAQVPDAMAQIFLRRCSIPFHSSQGDPASNEIGSSEQ